MYDDNTQGVYTRKKKLPENEIKPNGQFWAPDNEMASGGADKFKPCDDGVKIYNES